MLTKTLQFDRDVVEVLAAMTWAENGLIGFISQPSLERKLYERTNKALQALGGRWDKRAKGHVFSADPRPGLLELIGSGAISVDRDGFFETPSPLARQLVELAGIRYGSFVLEPSAGLGRIAKQVVLAGAEVTCIELNPVRASSLLGAGFPRVICCDFLSVLPDQLGGLFDAVIMNPPFEQLQDIDHVLHALTFVKQGGKLVAIMSESGWFRETSRAQAFRQMLIDRDAYAEKLPDGSFKASGSNVRTRLIIVHVK